MVCPSVSFRPIRPAQGVGRVEAMQDNDQSGGRRRWALRVVATAGVIGPAGTVTATSAFADMNGPWDRSYAPQSDLNAQLERSAAVSRL